jgi:long-chain acyl-CoA synthetase
MSEIPPPEEDFRVDRDIWPDELPRTLDFPNGRQPLHESIRDHAAARPEDSALTYYGRTLTWQEFDDAVSAFARAMVDRGHAGEVCGLFLQNCAQFPIAYHGAHRAGMAATPLNPQFAEPAAERQLDDSDATVLVTHTGLVDVARPAAEGAGVDDVLVTAYGEFAGDEGPIPLHPDVADEPGVEATLAEGVDREVSFTAVLDAGRDAGGTDADFPDVALDDVALLQYTGGTTGMPKGCVHTHWNVLFKATVTAQVRELEAADVSLGTMPIFHVAGKQRYCDALAVAGQHVVLLARYTPEAVMAAVDGYGVTSTWLAVPVIQEIIDHPDVDDYDLTSLSARRDLTNCSSFGETLTQAVSDGWQELTGAYVQESGYGLSETHTTDTHTYGETRIEPGFVGQPCYGVDIEIRDFETNEALPAGERGEIVLRTPATMERYLGRPDATEEVLEDDGFLHTGDVGRLTDEGYLYFLGRQKDTLKVSGHTVSPREIEVALIEHEYLEDAIVVGAPHERRGTVPEAHVIPTPDAPEREALEDAILAYAAESLAEFKRPQSVVVRDAFPRTDVGKIDRAAYRETLPERYH